MADLGAQSIPNLSLSVKTIQARDPISAGTALECGFSMLELLTVLAIITTLVAIGAPRYLRSSVRYPSDESHPKAMKKRPTKELTIETAILSGLAGFPERLMRKRIVSSRIPGL